MLEKTENGISVKTPFGTIEGAGNMVIMLFLSTVIIGFIVYVQYTNQMQHQAIVNSLNDVYIATMTSPEVKANLPAPLRDKLEEKAKQKAVQKLDAETKQ